MPSIPYNRLFEPLDTDDLDLPAGGDFDADDRRARVHRRSRTRPEPEVSDPFERRGRRTEEERARAERRAADSEGELELPDGAARWSTWDDGERGPQPYPGWVVTELAAVDYELGVIKTGKEAEVHLVERAVPDTDRTCLLAAKRYRAAEHRQFQRDATYLEGRRARKSRETRAMANRTSFGRNLIAEQWAVAEFAAIANLWSLGAPVPYPVQRLGRELLLEFVGDADGTAAPRLAQLRPEPDLLADLWRQLVDALVLLAGNGFAHGDMSAYNLLVHEGRVVLIDLPQVVDVVANPQGYGFLERDAANVCTWFNAHGLPAGVADPVELTELLAKEAGLA